MVAPFHRDKKLEDQLDGELEDLHQLVEEARAEGSVGTDSLTVAYNAIHSLRDLVDELWTHMEDVKWQLHDRESEISSLETERHSHDDDE